MLRVLKIAYTFGFVGLLILSACWILWTSLDFQECIKNYGQNNPSTEHLEKSISVFIVPIPTYRHCVGAYVTDKNAVITALGTVVIAVFTTILGIFTMGLAKSTRIAAEAAKEASNLANREFIASHRPKIRIRRITPIGRLLPNTRTNLTIDAANIGDTKATIAEIGFDIYIEGQPFNAIPRPYLRSEPLPPGQEDRMTAFSDRLLSQAEIDAIETGITEWRMLGIINYTDDNGVMRSTGFMRIYNRAMGRFVEVTEYDPDYDREFEN